MTQSHPSMRRCFIFVRGMDKLTSGNFRNFVVSSFFGTDHMKPPLLCSLSRVIILFFLSGRSREEEMQELNRATNSKMATFSFLSLLVCLAVAGLQLWHLKTFFERKKLL